MEILVSNLSGTKARREVLYGQDYLVAPIVLIVPGVLNGSEGALYYPPEEVSKDPNRWNFIPITLNHPSDSAVKPEILNRFGLGHLLNARYEFQNVLDGLETKRAGKLIADGWFNALRTAKADPRIITALNNGNQLEVSTGLRVYKELLTNEMEYGGKKYRTIAKNYQPDHLAILMETKGACSIEDGCGVLVNELKDIVVQCSPDERRELVITLNSSLTTGEPTMAKKELVDSLIQNCSCWTDTGEDRKLLEAMPDEKVQKLIDNALIVKNAKSPTPTPPSSPPTQPNPTPTPSPSPTPSPNPSPVPPSSPPTQPQSVTKEAVLNALKGLSPAEFFDIAPPEVQEDIKESRKIKEEAKAELVTLWVDNAAEDKKVSAKAWAEKQSLETLREVTSTIPVKNSANDNPYRANYSGAAPAVYNRGQEKIEKPTPLGIPEWNFDSVVTK